MILIYSIAFPESYQKNVNNLLKSTDFTDWDSNKPMLKIFEQNPNISSIMLLNQIIHMPKIIMMIIIFVIL